MASSQLAKVSKFWTPAKERAAFEVAEDKLPDEEIARNAGVTRPGLRKWTLTPEFAARVESHRDNMRQRILSRGIARVENRVQALQDRWERLQKVIEERAVSSEVADVPGGRTGLIVHNVKAIGQGINSQIVDEYALDTGLLSQLLAHEQQAAKELGQWVEKSEVETRDTTSLESLKRRLLPPAGAGEHRAVTGEPDTQGGD